MKNLFCQEMKIFPFRPVGGNHWKTNRAECNATRFLLVQTAFRVGSFASRRDIKTFRINVPPDLERGVDGGGGRRFKAEKRSSSVQLIRRGEKGRNQRRINAYRKAV